MLLRRRLVLVAASILIGITPPCECVSGLMTFSSTVGDVMLFTAPRRSIIDPLVLVTLFSHSLLLIRGWIAESMTMQPPWLVILLPEIVRPADPGTWLIYTPAFRAVISLSLMKIESPT